MKEFVRRNYVWLVALLIVVLLIVWGFLDYWRDYGYGALTEKFESSVERCEGIDFERNPGTEEMCAELVEQGVELADAFSMYFDVLLTKPLYHVGMIIPILIMIASVYSFHKKMKYGILNNELLRGNYSTYIRREIRSSYLKALSFLGIFILLFFICFLISGTVEVTQGYSRVEESLVAMLPVSYIVYLLVILFNYLLYVNLALLYTKRNKNLFVCITGAYLTWIAIAALAEVVVGNYLLAYKLEIPIGTAFYMMAIFAGDTFKESLYSLGLALVLFGVSSLIVYIRYRKKESVLIECGK